MKFSTGEYTLTTFPEESRSGFRAWFGAIREKSARRSIARRLELLSEGAGGDMHEVKPDPLGGPRVWELRVRHTPGWRIYVCRTARGFHILRGGTKPTQDRDIAAARALARTLVDAPERWVAFKPELSSESEGEHGELKTVLGRTVEAKRRVRTSLRRTAAASRGRF